MQELQRLINIYHTAFIICLVLAIALLALSIFLFFKYDIRSIFDMKSGRGAKKAIQKMQELNDRTGTLRDITETPVQLDPKDRVQHPTQKNPGAKPKPQPSAPQLKTRPEPKVQNSGPVNAPINDPAVEAGATAPLGRSAAVSAQPVPGTEKPSIIPGQEETSILTPEMNNTPIAGMEETTILSQDQLTGEAQPKHRFVIEKQLMWIHTEEVL